MELLRIRGGRRLEGSVAISGSKNAALPVMAAALLTDQEVELGNVPDIEDISTMARMLEHVGVAVEHPDLHTWRLHAGDLRTTEVDPSLSRRMRGSFLLLGALVARAGEAPGRTHRSQTPFMSSKVAMSVSQIVAERSLLLSVFACASNASMVERISRVCSATFLPSA